MLKWQNEFEFANLIGIVYPSNEQYQLMNFGLTSITNYLPYTRMFIETCVDVFMTSETKRGWGTVKGLIMKSLMNKILDWQNNQQSTSSVNKKQEILLLPPESENLFWTMEEFSFDDMKSLLR